MPTFNATFLSDEIRFNASMTVEDVTIGASWGDVVIIDKTLPEYEGSYDIIPNVEAQSLPTKDRQTREDIVIRAIPYSETSNVSGTTVVIAS